MPFFSLSPGLFTGLWPAAALAGFSGPGGAGDRSGSARCCLGPSGGTCDPNHLPPPDQQVTSSERNRRVTWHRARIRGAGRTGN